MIWLSRWYMENGRSTGLMMRTVSVLSVKRLHGYRDMSGECFMRTALIAVPGWTERETAMRLIDPDELERILRPILTDESCPLHIAAEIDMNLDLMQKVDIVPVRHGWWIDIDTETYTWKIRCSRCNHERSMMSTGKIYPLYCENCGARMDGDGNG